MIYIRHIYYYNLINMTSWDVHINHSHGGVPWLLRIVMLAVLLVVPIAQTLTLEVPNALPAHEDAILIWPDYHLGIIHMHPGRPLYPM